MTETTTLPAKLLRQYGFNEQPELDKNVRGSYPSSVSSELDLCMPSNYNWLSQMQSIGLTYLNQEHGLVLNVRNPEQVENGEGLEFEVVTDEIIGAVHEKKIGAEGINPLSIVTAIVTSDNYALIGSPRVSPYGTPDEGLTKLLPNFDQTYRYPHLEPERDPNSTMFKQLLPLGPAAADVVRVEGTRGRSFDISQKVDALIKEQVGGFPYFVRSPANRSSSDINAIGLWRVTENDTPGFALGYIVNVCANASSILGAKQHAEACYATPFADDDGYIPLNDEGLSRIKGELARQGFPSKAWKTSNVQAFSLEGNSVDRLIEEDDYRREKGFNRLTGRGYVALSLLKEAKKQKLVTLY